MPTEDFTDDENYLRSYYLHLKPTWLEHFSQNYALVIPAVIFATFSALSRNEQDAIRKLWIALALALGAYVWRMGGVRWLRATSSLIRKYEERLRESGDKEAD